MGSISSSKFISDADMLRVNSYLNTLANSNISKQVQLLEGLLSPSYSIFALQKSVQDQCRTSMAQDNLARTRNSTTSTSFFKANGAQSPLNKHQSPSQKPLSETLNFQSNFNTGAFLR